jgi:protein-disulfide isomerase
MREIHPYAERAAEAVEAAGAQGRFWDMHELLFTHQRALTDADLLRYARQLGLDLDRFEEELATGAFVERVRADFLSGVRSGVNATPTFFVNGRRYDGAWEPEPMFLDALTRAADAAEAAAGSGRR